MARYISTERIEKQHARVRALCMSCPQAVERLSHGEPTFFIKKRVFAMMSTDHHGDGRLAVVVPAPEGRQEHLVSSHPKRYFVPPYVGKSGWIGIHLGKTTYAQLRRHICEAWGMVAPAGLAKQSCDAVIAGRSAHEKPARQVKRL